METQECWRCSRVLPIDEFPLRRDTGKRRTWCHECEKARVRKFYADNAPYRERRKAASRLQVKTPEQTRKHNLKHSYGITPTQYDEMLASQDRKCALCGTDDPGRTRADSKWKAGHWNVDHDHSTGRVRGLLCHKCNVRVGAYEGLMDDVGEDRLMRYLHPKRYEALDRHAAFIRGRIESGEPHGGTTPQEKSRLHSSPTDEWVESLMEGKFES